MCGIIGYSGHRPAVPLVVEGLERLEYRGYDSAGVAWQMPGGLEIARAKGKLAALRNVLAGMPAIHSPCAMGHTRWATHGIPAERNAHPHVSNGGGLAIVHNGIIENFQELKDRLLEKGYSFRSETDTEVLVNLIEDCLKGIKEENREGGDPVLLAMARALRIARGAYAICLLCADAPGMLYGARNFAPLILGLGSDGNFIASDIPAFLPYTRRVVFLEDGDIARVGSSGREVYRLENLEKVDRPDHEIQWDMQAAQKDGYRHFMLKEIFEQPRVIRDGLAGRLDGQGRELRAELKELETMPTPAALRIVACGTSYHAGLWGKNLLEDFADIPVQVEIASEFRYRDPHLQPGEMALFISQSGETADTLAAMRLVRERGTLALGLCNVVGSTLAREADAVIYTQAGPEISVASTKAMCSQMLALGLMAAWWGRRKGMGEKAGEFLYGLTGLAKALDDNLPEMRKVASRLARDYAGAKNFFYLGRGQCYPLALEGALKLKELSYIHAEGYAAGEMKHGPIALVDPSFPTFAIAPRDRIFEKIKSNIEEVEARAGKVIGLTNAGADLKVNDLWLVPELPGYLEAFMILPAVQLFSYEMADYLGKDVDQPRNLAKSVTVE